MPFTNALINALYDRQLLPKFWEKFAHKCQNSPLGSTVYALGSTKLAHALISTFLGLFQWIISHRSDFIAAFHALQRTSRRFSTDWTRSTG